MGNAGESIKRLERVSSKATVLYQRTPQGIRFTHDGATNVDLRAVMLAIWAALRVEDRADAITELQHYQQGGEGVFLPDLAGQVCEEVHGLGSALCPRRGRR